MTGDDPRRKLPRTGSGIVRVVGVRVVMSHVDDIPRFCAWAREAADVEGADGWVAPTDGGVEAWFEGSDYVVEAMVAWCSTITDHGEDGMTVSWGRPLPCMGFEVLQEPRRE